MSRLRGGEGSWPVWATGAVAAPGFLFGFVVRAPARSDQLMPLASEIGRWKVSAASKSRLHRYVENVDPIKCGEDHNARHDLIEQIIKRGYDVLVISRLDAYFLYAVRGHWNDREPLFKSAARLLFDPNLTMNKEREASCSGLIRNSLAAPISRDFKGYWQRKTAQALCSSSNRPLVELVIILGPGWSISSKTGPSAGRSTSMERPFLFRLPVRSFASGRPSR